MSKRKKRGTPKKRGGGSMMRMRGGFRGMFSGSRKSKKSDPMQFFYIILALFALGALIFFGTR